MAELITTVTVIVERDGKITPCTIKLKEGQEATGRIQDCLFVIKEDSVNEDMAS